MNRAPASQANPKGKHIGVLTQGFDRLLLEDELRLLLQNLEPHHAGTSQGVSAD